MIALRGSMRRGAFKTKSDIIYQELKADIIDGKYKPEERIVISEVARKFGASDIPVREAMRHLESDGLIQNTPYVGAVVTNFDIDDIQKIYQIRTVLESMATRLSIQRIKKMELTLLEKVVRQMESAVELKNYGLLADLNTKYHGIIYSASGNEYLKKVIFELWNMSLRARAIFIFIPSRAVEALKEHKKILAAIKKRDGSLAGKLVVSHMNSHLNAMGVYYQQSKSHDQLTCQSAEMGSV